MKRERDYFLKDHLGNIRIVFETADGASSSYSGSSSVTYIATMEESKAAEEDLYFANVNTTRADRPFNYPDANPANAKVSKVPGKRRGPSIMLKVMAGDTIEVSARAFYNMENAAPGRGIDVAPILGSIISSMTNPVATAVGEASRLSSNVGTSSGYSSRYVTLPDKEPVVKTIQPKSGINFVLYNTAFEVVEENTEYLPVDDKLNAIQTLSTDRMVMQEAGFIEVFVDNQANTAVYYDNMMVVHSSGSSNVLEVNAYYPYGMLMPGLSLIAPPGKYNAYKHTAKELQKELNLQWYDHGARMYDPTVSRWWLPDPLAEKYYSQSPYNYAVNNPIRIIDPDGRDTAIFGNDNKFIEIRPGGVHIGQKLGDGGFFFKFADPKNDLKSIRAGEITSLFILDAQTILKDLERAAVEDKGNKGIIDGPLFLLTESNSSRISGGVVDFVTQSEIHGSYSEGLPIGLVPSMLYITETKGEKFGHNNKNFGNFMWGASANAVGVGIGLAQLAAHINNYIFDTENKGKKWDERKFDSQDDQLSIRLGWFWYQGQR